MASVEDVESERKEVQELAEWRLVSWALGVLPLNEFSTLWGQGGAICWAPQTSDSTFTELERFKAFVFLTLTKPVN